MRRSFTLIVSILAILGILGAPGEALSARRKAGHKKPTATKRKPPARKAPSRMGAKLAKPTPTPTRTPGPYFGPPAPEVFRAAGTCVAFEPGQYLMLAEVGGGGRIFHVDKDARIGTSVVNGARVRVLYLDGPEGPSVREILPGPIEVPAPK